MALVYLHDGDDDVPFVIRHQGSNPLPLRLMCRSLLVDVANGVACEGVEEFDVDVGAFCN